MHAIASQCTPRWGVHAVDHPTETLNKTDALMRRYGHAELPMAGPWNDTIELLLAHKSIRAFRSDPLPEGTLETLAAAAQSAATSSNMQMWSMIAITDPTIKSEIAKASQNQKHIEQCPLFIAFIADVSRNQRVGARAGTALPVLDHFESFLVASIDAALAAQNAVIAAESLGLGTVYIGAMRNDPRRVADLLGLPAAALGVFGLCVGYADETVTTDVKPRLPQNAVLFHGRYGVTSESTLIDAYDQDMGAFSKRHEMSDDTWTKRVINRQSNIKNLNGREALIDILHAMGFGLK